MEQLPFQVKGPSSNWKISLIILISGYYIDYGDMKIVNKYYFENFHQKMFKWLNKHMMIKNKMGLKFLRIIELNLCWYFTKAIHELYLPPETFFQVIKTVKRILVGNQMIIFISVVTGSWPISHISLMIYHHLNTSLNNEAWLLNL